jgi:hypothetical protein
MNAPTDTFPIGTLREFKTAFGTRYPVGTILTDWKAMKGEWEQSELPGRWVVTRARPLHFDTLVLCERIA